MNLSYVQEGEGRPVIHGFTAPATAWALTTDALVATGYHVVAFDRPETIKLLNDHALQDWRDVAERVARPVLMIAGRGSQIWPCEHAEAAITAKPLGRAVIIEDSGHTVSFDEPDRFNEVLLEFLRETGGI